MDALIYHFNYLYFLFFQSLLFSILSSAHSYECNDGLSNDITILRQFFSYRPMLESFAKKYPINKISKTVKRGSINELTKYANDK